MSISDKTKEEIGAFAKEQSLHYLNMAEMSYMERLKTKAGQTKKKAMRKLARFKGSSDKAIEATNDLELYMSDYIGDLISQGTSEEEALQKAKEELKASAPSESSDYQADFTRRMMEYYENRDPAADEAIGLLYGGMVLLGIVLGSLIGFITGGGRADFLSGGWIDTIIGLVAGVLLGTCCGMIAHAVITAVTRKRQ